MTDEKINENMLHKINTDKFWFDDPKVLIQQDRLSHFFPTTQMNMIEKLNAIARLGIYMSIVLILLTKKTNYIYISIAALGITLFMYKANKDDLELYLNNNNANNDFVEKSLLQKERTEPTVNNPFMNINLITDDKDRSKAKPTWDDPNTKKTVEEKFNYNLYRDVSDLYGKSNSQRQFYTAPSTTIPNDQTAFAKWCFNTGPTCKEKGVNCAPRYSPNTSQSNPFYNINDVA
jgi:hypothetical protein